MRALIVHKPSGRELRQMKALVRYCLRPGPASKNRERVLGIVDGLDLEAEDSPDQDAHSIPVSVDLIVAQLGDDVPRGRRLYRHAVLSLAAEAGKDLTKISKSDQVRTLKKLVRRYAATHAPGFRYVAVIHADHLGEGTRGLHAHIMFRNTNAKGRALDWSRTDLSAQQSMEWAAGLGVRPTRGTGIKRERGVKVPYPKSKSLAAKQIGELSYDQLEELVISGQLSAGRRNKSGILTSIVLNGRCIRISTARAIAQRERGLADLRPAGHPKNRHPARHRILNGMAVTPTQPTDDYSAGRSHFARSFNFGFGFGPSVMARPRRRKNRRGRSAIRGVTHGMKAVLSTLSEVDKIGRILR